MTREKTMPAPGRQTPNNFVEHLRQLARDRPDEVWLTVAGTVEGRFGEKTHTYRAFEQRVRALAAQLQSRCARAERALVMMDNDEHYAASMLACFYAGVIAVPVPPLESVREQHAERVLGIARDANARCVLTSAAAIMAMRAADGAFDGLVTIAADEVDPTDADGWTPHTPADDDLAFLQYTSGSTSAPKGVMVTHGNLMANERAIRDSMAIGADDKFVCWAPLYHDMGLIGGLLQPLFSGIPLVLTSPRHFLESPVRWLELISRHRATLSGGPDFAYRLCLDRVKDSQLAQLDLSTWRVAYTGAEPVRADTVTAFCERFAAAGFRPAAVYACYGLAEATLFVTGGQRGAGMLATAFSTGELARGSGLPGTEGTTLVACGAAPSGHCVEIVEPESLAVLAAGKIGEIWASGPSIGSGYWGKDRETRETFVERAGRRWLRTGDLGFFHAGQLHVAGRIKDLVIVRGHNLYPQDIEHLVETEVEAVRKGRVAAFAVQGPEGEGIGVAAEVSRSMRKLVAPQVLVDAISTAIGEVVGEAVSVVVLLNPGGLPKTSSGKLQRQACRTGWSTHSLDAYAVYAHGAFVLGASGDAGRAVQPLQDEVEHALANIWCEALRRDPADLLARDTHFFAAGGNSLAATQVAALVSGRWGVAFQSSVLFEHPRLSDCAAAIRMLQAVGAPGNGAGPSVLSAARRAAPLPLSHAQQRQWFLWHLEPSSTAYHVATVLRLSGRLDAQALRHAFDRLVERHESLRTVFRPAEDGSGQQIIAPKGALDFAAVDLRAHAADAIDARVDEETRRLNATPFDLTRGPLLRVRLLRTAEDAHCLVLVMHHIVSDGVSMQLLMDEVAAHYRDVVDPGAAANPQAPAIQYADYAAWHAAWLDSGERARQLAYWRAQLGEAHPVLALPSDRPRAAVARYQAARHQFELPQELVATLRSAAAARDASLFMALLAGFQAVLYRHTAQEDIRLGVPLANRHHAGTASVLGFFVNTLVLRNTVAGRMRLVDVLDGARLAALGAQAHQDLPFEQLVEALQPQRSLAHPPLFQVLFNHLQEDFRAVERLTGWSVAAQPVAGQAAQFEFAVEIRERTDGRVSVRMDYAAELFDPATIARLGRHYLRMLEALATRPDLAVGDVALLDDTEAATLAEWSAGTIDHAVPDLVHVLFETQARLRPHAQALVFEDRAWSYAQLNAQANRLAHHLIALGVRPEAKVGIAIERSFELVVGLLAIMKAGGAYVPIDPDYPADRIRYMVEDSGIGVLLTHGSLRERLPTDAALVRLEIDALDLQAQPTHDPGIALHGDNLVYLIYTSGSTGRPKGAGNRHRALCNRLAWGQRHQPLASGDTVLQKTPFSFDISFWEFFWPLTVGARLALAGPGEHRDPQRLVALIEQHAVTTIHFVPSMLQAFLGYDRARSCRNIRRIVCSGEALSADLQDKALSAFPGASLLNLYGPTEAAIEVSYWDCRNDGALSVPIGRPVANLALQVLDADLGLVPQGVAGELLLGGLGLARGYWGRPGLTAERFVADPLSQDGGRLYRTGDLVRWRADGQVEYLGRLDHQIKIRGFRIELGEIEAELLARAPVSEAVVVAHEGAAGAQLVAYIAIASSDAFDPERLKAELRKTLPDYMVPAAIVVLDRLPLNANGKVDRKALPVPEFASREAYEAPRGQVAQAIAAIWSQLLKVQRIGANDNFFDLGGHSLLLIRMHRLVEDQLNAGLTVIDMFRCPTIASLARLIEQGADRAAQAEGRAQDEKDERTLRQRAALLGRRPIVERTA